MPVRSASNITVVLLLLASAVFGDDASPVRELRLEPVDEARARTVPVKVYISGERFPQPVVLFSHGLGGSRENNAYLKGDAEAKRWLQSKQPISDTGLSDDDVWEWK